MLNFRLRGGGGGGGGMGVVQALQEALCCDYEQHTLSSA